MIALSRTARALYGLSALLLPVLLGCYSHTPFRQYGYGSGGYPMPRGNYVTPPGGAGSGATPQPRDGTLGAPAPLNGRQGSGLGAPQPGGSSPGNNTPRYEANNGDTSSEKNLVPDYQDPDDTSSNGTSGGETDPNSFNFDNSPDGDSNTDDNNRTDRQNNNGSTDDVQSPFGPGAAGNSSSGDGSIQLAGGQRGAGNRVTNNNKPQRFQPPEDVKALSGNEGGASTSGKTGKTAETPNPYAYDRQNYTWLRGKVDYDEKTQSWQIIYSLDPQDKYGGSFTLVDDPKLKVLQNDDVFLVEGKIDHDDEDARGKPRYEIDHLFGPLVPKSQLQTGRLP